MMGFLIKHYDNDKLKVDKEIQTLLSKIVIFSYVKQNNDLSIHLEYRYIRYIMNIIHKKKGKNVVRDQLAFQIGKAYKWDSSPNMKWFRQSPNNYNVRNFEAGDNSDTALFLHQSIDG